MESGVGGEAEAGQDVGEGAVSLRMGYTRLGVLQGWVRWVENCRRPLRAGYMASRW